VLGDEETLNLHECYSITDFSLRRQCDNTCDDCEKDIDCASLYPKQIEYNGRSLGGTCSSGQLILYGCENLGSNVCLEKDILPDGSEKCINEVEKKGCDIVNRITTGIECCSSDDCQGAGEFFCEWQSDTTSKCVLKAVCEKDKDCGTSDKCDSVKKEIIAPVCTNGQCEEKTLEEVECCRSSDCQDSEYCNSDYICTAIPQNINIEDLDSIENTGKTSSSLSKGSSSTGIIILIVFLILIGGSIGYFFYVKSKKKVKLKPKEKKEEPKEVPKGKFCPKCGGVLREKSRFCTKCGVKVKK